MTPDSAMTAILAQPEASAQLRRRELFRFCASLFLAPMALTLALLPLPLYAAAKPNIDITGYVIDLQLDPSAHSMTATAHVAFTAEDTIDNVTFELHNALKVDKVTDSAGHLLAGERGANSTINIALPTSMNKGQSATYTFVYGGTLAGGKRVRSRDSSWHPSATPSPICFTRRAGSP